MERSRRPVIAVVGSAGDLAPELVGACEDLGRALVDERWRLVTGGLSGVMEGVSRGAHSSAAWEDGDVVGVLPSYDTDTANPWVDIAIPTGAQLARNVVVVAMADVVVAVAGGAGTLSEIALAWQLAKPVVALTGFGGWAEELGGRALDGRHARDIARGASVVGVIELVKAALDESRPRPGDIDSGWRES